MTSGYTKTATERVVPISARLYRNCSATSNRHLRTVLRSSARSLLLPAFVAVNEAAGIPDLRFHDLRHTAATRMIEAGVPEPTVGRILGHKVAQTTRRYVNVDEAVARDAATRMDAHLEASVEAEREKAAVIPKP